MGLLVGILGFNTMAEQQAPLALRKEMLKLTVELLTTRLVGKETAVAICPEYFFAEPTVTTVNHGRGDIRSLDEEEKDDAFRFVQDLSAQNPRVIIFPGTIAWHKSFERQGVQARHSHGPNIGTDKGVTRYQKATAALMTSHQRALLAPYHPNTALAGNLNAWDGGYFIPDTSFNPGTLGTISPTLSVTLNTGTPLHRYTTKFSDTYGGRVAQVTAFQNAPSKKQRLVRSTAYVFQGGYCKFKYNKQGDFHEVLGGSNQFAYVPGVENGVFKLDNITFGVEVCLDHAIGFLRKNYVPAVDIHVVMSATVRIDLANIKASNGGHIIHSDAVPATSGVWKFQTAGPVRQDIPTVHQSTETVVASSGHAWQVKCFRIMPSHTGVVGTSSADTMLQHLNALNQDLTIAVGNPGHVYWSACLNRLNEINEVWAKQFKLRFMPTDAAAFLDASRALRAAVAAMFSPAQQYTLSRLWTVVKDLHALVVKVEPGKQYAAVLKKVCDDYVPLRQPVTGGGGNLVTARFTSSIRGCVCVDCGLLHDWTVSSIYSGSWHSCRTCSSIYCPPCGKSLASIKLMSRERTCRNCQGTTQLVA